MLINRVVNPVVRAILRSPLHGVLSRRLILLTYTRSSGAPCTIPVGYRRTGAVLDVQVGRAATKRWWRAVRRRPEVTVRDRGVERAAIATVHVGPDGAVSVELTPRSA